MSEREPIVKKFLSCLEGLLPYFIAFVGVLGFASMLAFFGVMIFDNVACFVGELFGITSTNSKKDTLEFLGWIISGLAAFYGLLVFNRRAAAQEKANELTAKGHTQDWLRVAVEHLANERTSVRIASFHEFFYLAKNDQDYASNILGILSAHLRYTRNAKDPEQELIESQILVDILFSPKTETSFGKFDYDLQRAHLLGVDFRKMHKPEGNVDFSYANLSEAVFNNADLSGFNFRKAMLRKTKFRRVNLQKANLHGADMSEADLAGADLRNADLSKVHLLKAKLLQTNLSEANLREAKLLEADLRAANLREANLLEADLSNAKLRQANFSGANLRQANFSGASLLRTNLSNADLFGADFLDADLSNADLRNADLGDADLSKARNLKTAKLSGAGYDEGTEFPDDFIPEDHGME